MADADAEAFEALDALASEVGGSASQYQVVVFKRRADGNRIARCKRIPLADFDPDKLPLMFGGGEYTLRVLDADGRCVKVFRLDFDPELYPAPSANPAPASSGAPAPGAAAQADPIAARLALLERSIAESQAHHTQFLETIVTAVLRGGPGSTAAPSLKEQIDTMRAVFELARPASTTPAQEIADAMRLGLDMAREAGGGGAAREEGGGDVMGQVIDKIVPAILSALQGGAPRRALPGAKAAPSLEPAAAPVPAGPIGLFGPSAPATPPAAPPEPASLPEAWRAYAFLRRYVQEAKQLATENVAPDLVAELLYQRIPERFTPDLYAFVKLDDQERGRVLVALDPTLEPFVMYLHQIAAGLREQFEDVEDNAAAGPAQT